MVIQNFDSNVRQAKTLVEDVKNCEVKDQTGLNDFQKLPTTDSISIPRVGINRFRLPIKITSRSGETTQHDAHANMYVALEGGKNGVSMSRLVSILQHECEIKSLNQDFFKHIISRYLTELTDEQDKNQIETAYCKLSFNYGVKQQSLKSENWGWQYYPVSLTGKISKEKGFEFFMKIEYEYSSTCPCSLSMAKQYEMEYRNGDTDAGSGIAAAHSQRSSCKATIQIKENQDFFIEDLITLLRASIPTETQSLVKRVDEQAFAILNGSYPIFVEHASKEVFKTFNSQDYILDWIASFEHYESLHSHNAAAVIFKGIEGGLSYDSIF
ncbi:GTP cyclohydrolase FolE2 [Bacteriovoracaceae bacterium]|nr:GTP cyclohydrolase FolE2 [Bacteriovoracaceae bacterium]